MSLLEPNLLVEQGNIEEAEANYEAAFQAYNRALSLYQQHGHAKGVVSCHLLIAQIHLRQGDSDSAIRLFTSALQLSKENDFFLLWADALSGLGNTWEYRGDHPKASQYLQQALKITQEGGDKFRELKILQNLGVVYRSLGQFKEAIFFHKQSLEIATQIGDKRGECQSLGNLGNVYRNLGMSKDALINFNGAFEIARQIGNKRSEGIHLGNIGLAYQDAGEYEKSVEILRKALKLNRQIGNKPHETITLGNLASSHFRLKQYDTAIQYYQQTIQLAKELEDKKNEGIQSGNLGELLLTLNRRKEAEQSLLGAIDICKLAIPPAAGAFSGSLATIYSQQGQIDKALLLLKDGEPLVRVIPYEYGKFLCKKAKVLHIANQTDKATEALHKAKEIAKQINATKNSELAKRIQKTERFLS